MPSFATIKNYIYGYIKKYLPKYRAVMDQNVQQGSDLPMHLLKYDGLIVDRICFQSSETGRSSQDNCLLHSLENIINSIYSNTNELLLLNWILSILDNDIYINWKCLEWTK